jgi:hypothetical protein
MKLPTIGKRFNQAGSGAVQSGARLLTILTLVAGFASSKRPCQRSTTLRNQFS